MTGALTTVATVSTPTEDRTPVDHDVHTAELPPRPQRTTMIPALEYKIEADKLSYRWTNVVKGFAMPVRAAVGQRAAEWIRPTEAWKVYSSKVASTDSLKVDPSFYVTVKPPAP